MLIVCLPDLYKNDLVEIYLKEDITEFTEANKVGMSHVCLNISLATVHCEQVRIVTCHVFLGVFCAVDCCVTQ